MCHGVSDRLVFVSVSCQTGFFQGVFLINQVGQVVHGQIARVAGFPPNRYAYIAFTLIEFLRRLPFGSRPLRFQGEWQFFLFDIFPY